MLKDIKAGVLGSPFNRAAPLVSLKLVNSQCFAVRSVRQGRRTMFDTAPGQNQEHDA